MGKNAKVVELKPSQDQPAPFRLIGMKIGKTQGDGIGTNGQPVRVDTGYKMRCEFLDREPSRLIVQKTPTTGASTTSNSKSRSTSRAGNSSTYCGQSPTRPPNTLRFRRESMASPKRKAQKDTKGKQKGNPAKKKPFPKIQNSIQRRKKVLDSL